MLLQQFAGAELFGGRAVVDVARPPVAIVLDGLHEFVGDAHGVVGVLEEDRAVGFAIDGAVVALLDQHVGLALLARLAVDELHDVRMVDVEDDHLGGAARFAAALDDAGEGVKTLHEADRPGSDAAAGEGFVAAAQRGEIRARAGAPLEEHALGLHQVHDGLHIVLHGVDEAGRALRLGLHADVEPDRRIEAHLLLDEQVRQVVAESVARGGGGEISAVLAPADDRIDHAADQLPHGSFALGRIQLAVEVFRRDDIGRRLRPGFGNLHIFLAEDHLPLFVADLGDAPFPFHGVKRRNAPVGKIAFEIQARFSGGVPT